MGDSGPTMTRAALYQSVQQAYNAVVRPYLPRKTAQWNGVPARTAKLLDAQTDYPDYKQGLIDAVNDHVAGGEQVTLVGGGRGVSSVHCVQAGAAHVSAYEAAGSMVDLCRETATLNDCASQITVSHALVGEAVEVYGSAADAEVLSPAALPGRDVLVLDCEGAEASILDGLTSHPPVVIVETHPERGVPADQSRAPLRAAGYQLTEYEYEPGARADKPVLVATRDGAVDDD